MRSKAKLVDTGCSQHFSGEYKDSDGITDHLWSGPGAETVRVVLLDLGLKLAGTGRPYSRCLILDTYAEHLNNYLLYSLKKNIYKRF